MCRPIRFQRGRGYSGVPKWLLDFAFPHGGQRRKMAIDLLPKLCGLKVLRLERGYCHNRDDGNWSKERLNLVYLKRVQRGDPHQMRSSIVFSFDPKRAW